MQNSTQYSSQISIYGSRADLAYQRWLEGDAKGYTKHIGSPEGQGTDHSVSVSSTYISKNNVEQQKDRKNIYCIALCDHTGKPPQTPQTNKQTNNNSST